MSESYVDKTRHRVSLVASFGFTLGKTKNPDVFQVLKEDVKAGIKRVVAADVIHRREFVSFLRKEGYPVEIKEKKSFDFMKK